MNITFSSRKFERQCNEFDKLVRKHGKVRAKKIRTRLDDLRAAQYLEDMKNLPGRCHELTGNRSRQLSLDLDHPYRLILEAAEDPPPMKDDGGLDWRKVQSVRIIGVEDTHE